MKFEVRFVGRAKVEADNLDAAYDIASSMNRNEIDELDVVDAYETD